MPASAFALLGVFILLAIAVGIAAAWIAGPRLRAAMVLPVLAAFGALYWLGHKSGLELGPTVSLFGYQVAIVQDVVAAVAAAGAAALIQRAVWTRRRVRQAASADATHRGV
jgi:hypothetical protein